VGSRRVLNPGMNQTWELAVEASERVTAQPSAACRPHVLSLCCLYPNPSSPSQGLFVQRRLRYLAELCELRVVAPFAIVQYGNPAGKRLRIGKSACPKERADSGIPVLHPRWWYPPFSGSLIPCWLFLQLLRPVALIRREFRFDIIDTHFGHPEGVAGCLLALAFGVPFTITLRGNEPKHSRSSLQRFWMGLALRRASRVFAVSNRLGEFAANLGANPEKIKTIPNGVDAHLFRPRERAECRRKQGLPAHAPLILSAGALVERKGHHRTIQALQSLGSRDVHLAIAGGPGPEGQYEKVLRDLVAQLGLEAQVHFLGPLPEEALAEVMSASDVLCLASTNEGWPNVVHEALACGTPVVATDVGAVPEMLNGGRFGIVVPVNDAEKLRLGLEDALGRSWDRQAIAEWGQSRAWDHVAAEVWGEMRAILAEKQMAQKDDSARKGSA
jgi:teichuronic acid biosynthesis glycosyltransferase TuaC